MESFPAEEVNKYGGNLLERALQPELGHEEQMGEAEALAARHEMHHEIDNLHHSSKCDAIVLPEQWGNPAGVCENPSVCLPMGVFDSTADRETDPYFVFKDENMP